MKFIVALALLLVIQMAASTTPQYGSLEEEWPKFKVDHNKVYKDAAEEAKRKAIFAETLSKIKEHNRKYDAGEESFTMGLSHLSDLEHHEIPTGFIGGLGK